MNDRNAFRAGLFILATIAGTLATIVAIKGAGRFVEPRQTRAVDFRIGDDAGGLRVGDDVRIGGVKQGEVRTIDLRGHQTPEPDDDRVIVHFSIPQRFVLRQQAAVRVQSTVTGTSWLNIEHLGAGEALAADAVIAGRPGQLSELFAAIGEVGPELTATLRDVRGQTLPRVNDTAVAFRAAADSGRGLLSHMDAQVEPTAGKVQHLADEGAATMSEVRSLLGDSGGDIRGTLANLNQASDSLNQRLPAVLDQVEAGLAQLNEALDDASAALVDLKQTATNVRDASAAARSVIVSNRAKIDGMIVSLETTGTNLRAASAEIRHSPWRLLYKPGKGEMANMTLYDSARLFAEGAGELNGAAAALRDALNDPATDPQRLQALVNELDRTFGEFQTVEEQLWGRVKE